MTPTPKGSLREFGYLIAALALLTAASIQHFPWIPALACFVVGFVIGLCFQP